MNKLFGKSIMLLAALLMAVVAFAAEPAAVKINVSKLDQLEPAYGATGEDRQLAAKRADFARFAAAKVREMNQNHILSRERMRVGKLPDGFYQALFHEIDDSSLSYQVNPSVAGSATYVAVLSYREQVFTASGATPDECRRGPFTPVEIISNRHIFVYSNGVWQ